MHAVLRAACWAVLRIALVSTALCLPLAAAHARDDGRGFRERLGPLFNPTAVQDLRAPASRL
jgi:hypothetical protein